MGKRPTPAQLEELRRAHLDDHPYDTAVVRAQPQDPDAASEIDPEQADWDDAEIWEL